MSEDPYPIFVNTSKAANLLGVSVSTLEKWRFYRVADTPGFVKIGSAVRYPLTGLRQWADSRELVGRALVRAARGQCATIAERGQIPSNFSCKQAKATNLGAPYPVDKSAVAEGSSNQAAAPIVEHDLLQGQEVQS